MRSVRLIRKLEEDPYVSLESYEANGLCPLHPLWEVTRGKIIFNFFCLSSGLYKRIITRNDD